MLCEGWRRILRYAADSSTASTTSSLGKDATKSTVVQQLAKIIKASGGSRLAKEVLEEESIDGAVSSARQWFEGNCVLLLIDDAWEERPNVVAM